MSEARPPAKPGASAHADRGARPRRLLPGFVGLALAVTAALGAARASSSGPSAARTPMARSATSAQEFLAAVRGADPVVCALAARTVSQRWGGRRLRMLDDVSDADPARLELLMWAEEGALSDDDIDALAAALADTDACVRRMSAIMLGRAARHSETPAARALVSVLGHHAAQARLAAAQGLGVAEHGAALGPLLAALEDGAPEVRATAAWALGRLEDREAVRPLIERLGDGDPRVRRNAAWALGEIEDRSAVDALAGLLRTDADPRVRLAAAWALGHME